MLWMKLENSEKVSIVYFVMQELKRNSEIFMQLQIFFTMTEFI